MIKKLEEEKGESIEGINAFYRYINRESHSDSININDSKEIDVKNFLDRFKDVFKQVNCYEHYKKMMDEDDSADSLNIVSK